MQFDISDGMDKVVEGRELVTALYFQMYEKGQDGQITVPCEYGDEFTGTAVQILENIYNTGMYQGHEAGYSEGFDDGKDFQFQGEELSAITGDAIRTGFDSGLACFGRAIEHVREDEKTRIKATNGLESDYEQGHKDGHKEGFQAALDALKAKLDNYQAARDKMEPKPSGHARSLLTSILVILSNLEEPTVAANMEFYRDDAVEAIREIRVILGQLDNDPETGKDGE